MSSTESSGAPAEASVISPASNAESSFGSTRGSGLARGKAKRPSAPAAATAASSDYTPTAIAVVTAPREYQNPFAPVETPVAATEPVAAVAPAPAAPAPARPERAEAVAPVKEYSAPAPVQNDDLSAEALAKAEPAELNILEPEQPKASHAQTWESEGFRPARESRSDRPRREETRREEPRREEPRREEPRREENAEQAPFDPASIPAKFLYVRPGYNYVPTPSNFGGAPRVNRENRPAASEARPSSASVATAPAQSGGFFGWLKSLFGSSDAAPAAAAAPSAEPRSGDRQYGRNRGDRGRGPGGGGGDGQRRRSRGGRGRSQSRGEYRNEQGSSQGGV